MADAVVGYLIQKLGTLLVSERRLQRGVGHQVKELKEELKRMKDILKDVDAKRDIDDNIRTWVKQVRRAAYDIEDVIDEFMDGSYNSTHKIRQLKARRDFEKKIQNIRNRIDGISQMKDRYALQRTTLGNSSYTTNQTWRGGDAYLMEQRDFVGFQKDVDSLITKLVNEETFRLLCLGHAPKVRCIIVAGMGGSGKTTLITKVYNDPKVKKHFDCRAWVAVSQSFDTRDLLKRMLKEFCGKLDQEKMDETDMKEELKGFLKEKRYMLVLDDVWDAKAWNAVKAALPMNFNGSTIMVTTRIKSIDSALKADGVSSCVHLMKPLPHDEALALFCRKAFRESSVETSIPQELQQVCDDMLKKCEGLPLAIAVLGGVISKKERTQLEWKKVYDSLGWHLSNGSTSENVRSILKLSYSELPRHLKSCLLFCALFPKDHVIVSEKLIRLWIVEGFIEEARSDIAEKVGEDYLMQLIDRSMLLVAETGDSSRVRFCRMHDLMRDLAVEESKEEEFCIALNTKTTKNIERCRHLSIITKDAGYVAFVSSNVSMPYLHSLLTFRGYKPPLTLVRAFSKFKLLRILDLEGADLERLPSEVIEMFHLRFLSLSGNEKLTELPGSIRRLQNLKTLDISFTGITSISKGICKMKSLRHLEGGDFIQGVKLLEGISNLRCLHTLRYISGSREKIIQEIGNLTALRNLGITDVHGEHKDELFASIQKMVCLSELRVAFNKNDCVPLLLPPLQHLETLWLRGGLEKLPIVIGCLPNLTVLLLWETKLSEDPFSVLQSCPRLVRLMIDEAYDGHKLECEDKGFPKLKHLHLSSLYNLESVVLPKGAMPNLKELNIDSCHKLKTVPHGVQYLTNLQKLSYSDMPIEFMLRLSKDGDEDQSLVQHIPLIEERPW